MRKNTTKGLRFCKKRRLMTALCCNKGTIILDLMRGNIKSKPRFLAWCRFVPRFFNCERRIIMANYKELYNELFNKVTDVIEQLKDVQREMEEKYIESDDE